MKNLVFLLVLGLSSSFLSLAQSDQTKPEILLTYCGHDETKAWTNGLQPNSDTSYSCMGENEYMMVKMKVGIENFEYDHLHHWLSAKVDQEIIELTINEDFGTNAHVFFSFTTADGNVHTGVFSKLYGTAQKE